MRICKHCGGRLHNQEKEFHQICREQMVFAAALDLILAETHKNSVGGRRMVVNMVRKRLGEIAEDKRYVSTN